MKKNIVEQLKANVQAMQQPIQLGSNQYSGPLFLATNINQSCEQLNYRQFQNKDSSIQRSQTLDPQQLEAVQSYDDLVSLDLAAKERLSCTNVNSVKIQNQILYQMWTLVNVSRNQKFINFESKASNKKYELENLVIIKDIHQYLSQNSPRGSSTQQDKQSGQWLRNQLVFNQFVKPFYQQLGIETDEQFMSMLQKLQTVMDHFGAKDENQLLSIL